MLKSLVSSNRPCSCRTMTKSSHPVDPIRYLWMGLSEFLAEGCLLKETYTPRHSILAHTSAQYLAKNRAKSRWHSAQNLKDSFCATLHRLQCRVCAITWCIASVKSQVIRLNSFDTSLGAASDIFANLRLLNRTMHPHSGNEFLHQGL